MAKNPKRIISKVVKEDIFPHEFETSLGNLHAKIRRLISTFGHDARLDWDENFHYAYDSSPSPRFRLLVNQPETDAEYEKRLSEENAHRIAVEKHELDELARLQAKFGNK